MKKLSIRFLVNFAFAFILLSYFLLCIYQNLTEPSLFKEYCQKIYTPERVWRGVANVADLSAYSAFLKENLFKDDCYDHVLVMSGLNETNDEYFFSWGPSFLGGRLFPVKIEIDNSYKFILDAMAFKKLSKLPLITRMYDVSNKDHLDHLAKRYCLVQGIETKDYKKWAIYVFPTNEVKNIFTLPIGWQGIKDSN